MRSLASTTRAGKCVATAGRWPAYPAATTALALLLGPLARCTTAALLQVKAEAEQARKAAMTRIRRAILTGSWKGRAG